MSANAKTGKKLSAINAAAKILATRGKPTTTQELIEAMKEQRLWRSPNGQTPHLTLYSAILREIKTKGTESRFEKAGPGKFRFRKTLLRQDFLAETQPRKDSTLLHVFRCEDVELNSPDSKPRLKCRLASQQAAELHEQLRTLADSSSRAWYHLTWSNPDLKNLRLVNLHRPPDYELSARGDYLRGDVFRVTGKEQSCNITFSSIGSGLLAARMKSVLARTDQSIDLVIPNRHGKKDLIEFIADVDRLSEASEEHDRLAQAGTILAGQTLEAEDFSDWE